MKRETFDGEALYARRTEMGLTSLDVSRKIRVPVDYIDALERGDLRALPPACYTTGFIKSYCSLLGQDAAPFLAKYAAVIRPPRRGGARRPAEFGAFRASRRLADVFTWAVVCGALALGWLAYMLVVDPQIDGGEGRVEAGVFEILEPQPPLTPE